MTSDSTILELVNSSFSNQSAELTTSGNLSVSKSDAEVQILATLEQRQYAQYVLYYYVLPFIALVGIVGNTLSLSLLRFNNSGYAFNTYLSALTVFDILLLWTALARCIVIMVARSPDTLNQKLEIYGEYFLSLVLGSWLQRMSSTLISIIAIERFIAVVFPFKVKTLGIETHPARTLMCTIIGTILIQVPTFVLLEVNHLNVSDTNEIMYRVGLREPSRSAMLARRIYLIILAVANMFVPILIVATTTGAIVICLKLHSSTRLVNRIESKDSDKEAMTWTLIALSFIFTLCYIPALLIFLLPSTYAEFYRREKHLIYIAVDVNIVTLCLNSACDFLIYFMASRKFRALFCKRYCPCYRIGSSNSGGHVSNTSDLPEVSSHSLETNVGNVSENVEMYL